MHEELHSPAYARSGGRFKLAQLWVNLPAAHKMTDPRYQAIAAASIPQVPVANGNVRVIAGQFGAVRGPAQTFSELNVWDARLQPGTLQLPVPESHQAIVAVMEGSVQLPGGALLGDGDSAVFGVGEGTISLDVQQPGTLFVATGVPIDEPIAGYGPFVMNTREQIIEAMQDVDAGRFGRL